MPYRTSSNSLIWHWCYNCSDWPLHDFRQREDKPPTWTGQALCEECATCDGCSECQHSIALRAGLPSDSWLETSSEHVSKPKAAGRLTERLEAANPPTIL
jgi:hypothetical protein